MSYCNLRGSGVLSLAVDFLWQGNSTATAARAAAVCGVVSARRVSSRHRHAMASYSATEKRRNNQTDQTARQARKEGRAVGKEIQARPAPPVPCTGPRYCELQQEGSILLLHWGNRLRNTEGSSARIRWSNKAPSRAKMAARLASMAPTRAALSGARTWTMRATNACLPNLSQSVLNHSCRSK